MKEESKPYSKRLRKSEVQQVLEYKRLTKLGRIPDFKPISDILEKIEWFKSYSYTER